MLFKSRVDLRVNLCLWCQIGIKIKNQQNQVMIVLTMVAYDLMYTVIAALVRCFDWKVKRQGAEAKVNMEAGDRKSVV